MTYRILITGSRAWDRPHKIVFEVGLAIGESGAGLKDIVIVHGDCRSGADMMADRLALREMIECEPHPADWTDHGKHAGFLRNSQMVALGADICLAFIKDESHGATDCADKAEAAGIPVRRFT